MRLLDINRPHLRCQDHLILIRNIIPGGAQAVAVKDSPQHIPVTEYNGCRAVPWFHHGSIIPVEILHLLRHALVVSPGGRNGNHHRQRQLHAAHHHKFQSIVQHGGVRALLIDDGQYLVHLRLEKVGLHGFFPGQHLIYIAPDGIDLPVMDNDPVGMGTHPAGIGVGAEPGMNHRQGRFIIRILKILKKLPQLSHQEHALVDNSTAA